MTAWYERVAPEGAMTVRRSANTSYYVREGRNDQKQANSPPAGPCSFVPTSRLEDEGEGMVKLGQWWPGNGSDGQRPKLTGDAEVGVVLPLTKRRRGLSGSRGWAGSHLPQDHG
jgi:hypothetical protein